MFPSPIGELHFSINKTTHQRKEEPRFPSPIGELHFSIDGSRIQGYKRKTVSVPYRGATFLNDKMLNAFNNSSIGFRPLSGSYISQWEHASRTVFEALPFPSPIGELHFSIELAALNSKCVNVSVPYRGATFLNTIPATPCPVWDE